MNPLVLFVALMMLVGGCSKEPELTRQPERAAGQPSALPARLDSYFEQYCDATGALGIGFVPWHAYDYRFRQHLKVTQDAELKRLFVLQNLHRDVEWALDHFEKGVIEIGKARTRPLTLVEWRAAQKRIQTQIDDLAIYTAFTNFTTTRRNSLDAPGPRGDSRWIELLREKLRSVTNVPAANIGAEANRR